MYFFRMLLLCGVIAWLTAGCSDNDPVRDSHNDADDSSPPAPVVLEQTSMRISSAAQPANTPGSPGVVTDSEPLIALFGNATPDLNQALYTKYSLSSAAQIQPDAILVLMPGFEGGAANFAILADQLMRWIREEENLVLEVWAMDRRSEQLEDRLGLELAEQEEDPQLALDFLFGEPLGLELDSRLDRRLVSFNSSDDLAFIANWTPLVHSLDIDAVVAEACAASRACNVFLGGHSAGTGYAARYAATDFDFSEAGVNPGYEKLRGLVLLEGGGGRLGDSPSEEVLDRIEARFDGGLFGAVRDQLPRCIDGITACSIDTETQDCAAFSNFRCTEPVSAYATGLINTQTFAAAELVALDGDLVGDNGLSILQTDQGETEGNNALAAVPELLPVRLLLGDIVGSSVAIFGQYIDDDGLAAAVAPFLATSVGAPGPEVDGLSTWLNIDEAQPDSVLADNGPAPTDLDAAGVWGVEREVSDLEGKILAASFRGDTNFFDWYYPSSGLGVTAGLGLDTTALSAPPPAGRGRSDIDNRTQTRAIDIPVIAFGGSNGLTPVPGSFTAFATAIGTCSAPSCDGSTPRLVDAAQPSTAFPGFGEVAGGFEVYISEGYAHLDILTADNEEGNRVIVPLSDFIARNIQ